MYNPTRFQEDDPAVIREIMADHSFAILVSSADNGAPTATHLPVLFQPEPAPHGALVSHMARANHQWRHFASGREALVIFQGPHAYISPGWYRETFKVPTWNYVAVHAYGAPEIVADQMEVRSILDALIAQHEAHRPDPYSVPWQDDRYGRMLDGLVAFRMPISRIEAKRKLSQNRPQGDRRGVVEALSTGNDAERAIAAAIIVETETTETEEGREP